MEENGTKRVLIIDNDKEVGLAIENIVVKEGWNFLHVQNGEDSLEVVEEFMPDVIFLDYFMPGLNGVEIFREFRNRGISSPVIFLTVKKDDELIKEFLALGVFGYLSKPFHSSAVIFLLSKAYKYKSFKEKQVAVDNKARDFDRLFHSLKERKGSEIDTELNKRILIDRQRSYILDRFYSDYKTKREPLIEIINTIEILDGIQCKNENCEGFIKDLKNMIKDIDFSLSETTEELEKISERLEETE